MLRTQKVLTTISLCLAASILCSSCTGEGTVPAPSGPNEAQSEVGAVPTERRRDLQRVENARLEAHRLEGERRATATFLSTHEADYREALQAAEQWLESVQVDPFELRRRGIKGKKKLVELLDGYVRLWQLAAEEDRARYLRKISDIVAVTYERRFHDMADVGNLQFKQDSTSYLRAAYLMEQVGLDTTLYREEIAKIKVRLDAHMTSRGSHQRMAFHWYYDHFGMDEPFDLAAGYDGGIIDGRRDPYTFANRLDTYHLTHEIFIPYRYGEELDPGFFDADELAYLRRTLSRVMVYWIMRDDADLVAELVSSMAYLELTDSAVYREGLEYLLNAQRENGSWGRYDGGGRKRYGEFVDQALYLHTTMVAIDALTVAFEMRR